MSEDRSEELRDKQTRTEDIDFEAIKSGLNFFEDEGEHRDENDKKLYVKPPERRSRPKTLIDKKCTGCNRSFKISKSVLVEGKYTCSKCIVSKGRR